jgi:hypothetical protein
LQCRSVVSTNMEKNKKSTRCEFASCARKLWLSSCLVLLCNIVAVAQIEFANGIDFVLPVLTNKYNSNLYYNQLGGGLHFGISYKAEETQFFPTLNLSFGATKLPVTDFGANTAVININYLNLMLNGNIVVRFPNNNALFLLEGFGFSNFKNGLPEVAGTNGGSIPIHLDSTQNIDHFFPSLGGGAEYVYGEGRNKNLYMAFGVYVQYIILLPERNSYFFTTKDTKGNYSNPSGALIGNIIFPSLCLSLHYTVSKNILFWKKKDRRLL